MTDPVSTPSIDELLAALRSAARPNELQGEADVLTRMGAVLAGRPGASSLPAPKPEEPKRMLAKLLTIKAAGAVAAGLLTAGTAAAAASGNLPLVDSAPPEPTVTTIGATTTTELETTATSDALESVEPPEGSTADPSTVTTVTPATTSSTAGSVPEASTADVEQACEDAANHGAYVSEVAHSADQPGRERGEAISEAARSDCGKPATGSTEDDDEQAEEDSTDDGGSSQAQRNGENEHGSEAQHGNSNRDTGSNGNGSGNAVSSGKGNPGRSGKG